MQELAQAGHGQDAAVLVSITGDHAVEYGGHIESSLSFSVIIIAPEQTSVKCFFQKRLTSF